MQLVHLFAGAQTLSKVTDKYNLPKSGVYQVRQDSDGFLWFSHRTGVTCFNGINKRNFEFTDGLPALSVYQTYEDSKQRTWFYTDGGELCYFFGNKLFTQKDHPGFDDLNFSGFITTMAEDKNGNIWVGSVKNGLAVVTPDNNIERLKKSPKYDYPESIFGLLPLPNNQLLCFSSQNIAIIDASERRIVWQDKIWDESVYTVRYQQISEEEVLFFSATDIRLFNLKTKTTEFVGKLKSKDEVIFISRPTSAGIFVGKRNGLYVYEPSTRNIIPYEFPFTNNAVSSVIETSPGEFWITTLESGVFQIRQYPVTHHIATPNPVFTLNTGHKDLFVGFNNGSIARMEGKTLNETKLSRSFSNAQEILFLDDKYTAYFSLNYISVKGQNEVYNVPLATKATYLDTTTNTLFIGFNAGFFKLTVDEFIQFAKSFSMKKLKELILSVNFENHTKSFFKLRENRLLVGTTSGLFEFDILANKLVRKIEAIPPIPIMSMSQFQDDWLVMTTFGSGVIYYNFVSGEQFTVTTDDGLNSNFFTDAYIDNDKTLWLISQKGLSSIDIKDLKKRSVLVQNYNESDGLPNATVHDIINYKDEYFVGCENGIFAFNKDSLYKKKQNRIYKPTVHINPTAKIIKLDNKNPNVIVSFGATDFFFKEQPRFYYKLEGRDTDWKVTTDDQIVLADLEAGDYKFFLKYQSGSGIFSKTVSKSFTIKTPFYESCWFVFFCCSFTFLLVYWLFWSGTLKADFTRIKNAIAVLTGKISSNVAEEANLIIKTTEGDYKKMPLSALYYISASGNYIEYHTKTEKYLSRNTMKKVESELADIPDLIRIHRSYIINTNYLQRFDSKTLEVDGVQLPIGKNYIYLLDKYKSKLKID